MTEITAVRTGLHARVRSRFSRPAGPPSLRAQIVLLLSAFLLGGVLSALLFVGVWRHTAAEGDRARTAQLETRHALASAQARLEHAEATLAATHAALTKTRRARRLLAAQLAVERRVNGRAARSLTPRLQSIAGDADALGHQTAKLASALATLSDYLRNASATGVDPAFLGAQVRYLIGSANTTRATAAGLAGQVGRAQSSAASLRKKR